MSSSGLSASRFLDRRAGQGGLRPRDAAYLIVAVWLVAVILWGVLEHIIDKATFPTIWLGMWWSLQTVTTVGYGDVVPVSTAGRVLASFMLLGGLALISVVTASITSGFVARAQQQRAEAGEDPAVQRLVALDDRLARIEKRFDELTPSV